MVLFQFLITMNSHVSLKIEAHHDKVTNKVAVTTKQMFLEEEVIFLREIKDQCEALNQIIKSNDDPKVAALKASKKIKKGLEERLRDEVLFTRREISMESCNQNIEFYNKIGRNYEQSVELIGSRLQNLEGRVQKIEEKKKITREFSDTSPFYNLKQQQQIHILKATLDLRKRIQEAIKKRIYFVGKIANLNSKQSNLLILSKCKQDKYNQYNFKKEYASLYRNKSCERKNEYLDKIQLLRKQAKKKEQVIQSKLINFFQKIVFEEQLDNIRNKNMKLQTSIETLKKALTERQNSKILIQLNSRTELGMQETIARQVIAYQHLSKNFQEKLQASSFLWTLEIDQPCKLISKQENFQADRLQQNRKKLPSSKNCQSLQKFREISEKLTFDTYKSNGRTNCSSYFCNFQS